MFWGSLVMALFPVMIAKFATVVERDRQQVAYAVYQSQETSRKEDEMARILREQDAELSKIEAALASSGGAVADIEALLPFTAPWRDTGISGRARQILHGLEQWSERTAALLGQPAAGSYRIDALTVLTDDVANLPTPVRRQCWQALAELSAEYLAELQGRGPEPALNQLFRAALQLMDHEADSRVRHRAELTADEKVVQRAEERHLCFLLEATMRLRDVDHPEGNWAGGKLLSTP